MKYLISIFTLIIFIQFSYSDEIINCSTCGNIINKEYSHQFKKLFKKKNNLNIKESLTSSSSKQKTTSEDKSIENKLKELNALYKKGLINKEALTNLQIKLLSK